MQDANFMEELRARHPPSPPELNHLTNQGYAAQNYVHGQNFKMQSIHYPGAQNNGQSTEQQVQEFFAQQVEGALGGDVTPK